MNKKIYEAPEAEVTVIGAVDIIASSGDAFDGEGQVFRSNGRSVWW